MQEITMFEITADSAAGPERALVMWLLYQTVLDAYFLAHGDNRKSWSGMSSRTRKEEHDRLVEYLGSVRFGQYMYAIGLDPDLVERVLLRILAGFLAEETREFIASFCSSRSVYKRRKRLRA